MVEHYTSEAIHRLCGNTHTLGQADYAQSSEFARLQLEKSSRDAFRDERRRACLADGLKPHAHIHSLNTSKCRERHAG
jgi:hypothetical protein